MLPDNLNPLTFIVIKKNIPNFFTCLNLLCGCIGIVLAFRGELVWTAYMVGIAAVMDFLDGFVARLLKVHSEIGKQLDSLADMVTFGVVPGVVMFKLFQESIFYYGWPEDIQGPNAILPGSFGDLWIDFNNPLTSWQLLLPFSAFLITIFSAIRLAKFNIDTRQADSFIGVPTPANSILICSLPLVLFTGNHLNECADGGYSGIGPLIKFWKNGPDFLQQWIMNPWFLLGLTLVMSFLLVAELPLFALKFKNFSWKDNKIRFIFLALCLALLIIFRQLGIPFIIVLYILMSVVNNSVNRNKRTSSDYE
ncbi:MAG TPA: CDP-alcohol phosphatidyltransferase family protein [Bacteroidia bacterium]